MIWDFDPVAFGFLGLEVRWYGLSYILGFFLVLKLGFKLQQKSLSKALSQEAFENLIIGLFLAGILGGRLGFFLFYLPEIFWIDPLEVFKIWHGGMSIHGGLLGGIAWLWYFARKNKLSLWVITDVLVIPLALALAFGRLANFINGELVGTPTDQTWGMIFPHIDDLYRHPSQLYEMMKNIGLFVMLNKLFAQGLWKKRGLLTSVFFAGYAILRFLIEFVREPDAIYFFLSTGQWLCVIMLICAFSLYRYTQSRCSSKN